MQKLQMYQTKNMLKYHNFWWGIPADFSIAGGASPRPPAFDAHAFTPPLSTMDGASLSQNIPTPQMLIAQYWSRPENGWRYRLPVSVFLIRHGRT